MHILIMYFSLSGCLNGGGQIKPKMGQSAKDVIQQLEKTYMQDVSPLLFCSLGKLYFSCFLLQKFVEACSFVVKLKHSGFFFPLFLK